MCGRSPQQGASNCDNNSQVRCTVGSFVECVVFIVSVRGYLRLDSSSEDQTISYQMSIAQILYLPYGEHSNQVNYKANIQDVFHSKESGFSLVSLLQCKQL